MPGLIEAAQAGQEQQVAQQEPEQQQEEAFTPEEDEAYEASVNMAAEMLYASEESSEGIQEQLAQGDKLAAIANVTTFLIAQIEEAFQGQLPETVIVPLADEISDLVMELGMESGAFELSDDDIIQAKGTTMTALFDAYGVEEEDLEGMVQGVTGEEIAEVQSAFGGGV